VLGKTRAKLYAHLDSSQHYSVAVLLSRIEVRCCCPSQ
jgi:hypothetical protein